MRYPSTMSRRALVAGFLASALALAGCSTSTTDQASTPTSVTVMDEYELNGLDARQIIDRLDAMAVDERPETLLASVQPDELVLTDTRTGQNASVPMPDGQFYLSLAPYERRTHDCYLHSLTTCLGEQPDESMQVTVTDDATGQTIVDDTKTTFDNGFIGLWLPRDITGTLTVEHEGATATAPIATGSDDLTCLTSLQLT